MIENHIALRIHEYRPTADDVIFHCADCNEVLDQSEWDNEVNDLKFCGNCIQNLSRCGICEERFAHDPLKLHDLEFCGDDCLDTYKQDAEIL